MGKLSGLNDAPNNPVKWLGRGLDPKVPYRELSVKVRRYYGTVDIEFGAAMIIPIAAPEDERRVWAMLYDEVTDEHDLWAETILPTIKPTPTGGHAPTNTDGAEEYDAVELIVDQWNGKVRYRIRTTGGKYSKFGATVYPDMAEKYGLTIDKGEPLPYSRLIPWARIIVQGGAVRRIERIAT